MSAHVVEARAGITQILDSLLHGEGDRRYVICDSSEDDTGIADLYRAATRYLEAKLGRPNYSGRVHAVPAGNDEANPGVFIDDYSHAMEISWWKSDHGVYAALMSGHDADTVRCFTALYRKAAP